MVKSTISPFFLSSLSFLHPNITSHGWWCVCHYGHGGWCLCCSLGLAMISCALSVKVGLVQAYVAKGNSYYWVSTCSRHVQDWGIRLKQVIFSQPYDLTVLWKRKTKCEEFLPCVRDGRSWGFLFLAVVAKTCYKSSQTRQPFTLRPSFALPYYQAWSRDWNFHICKTHTIIFRNFCLNV